MPGITRGGGGTRENLSRLTEHHRRPTRTDPSVPRRPRTGARNTFPDRLALSADALQPRRRRTLSDFTTHPLARRGDAL